MKLKKILGITGLAVASTVALAACGAGGNKSAKDDKTLTVGVMTLDDTTEPLLQFGFNKPGFAAVTKFVRHVE